MTYKQLFAQLQTEGLDWDEFFYQRVADFHPSEEVFERIKTLREQVPDELTDLFLELDEAYVDFVAVQNTEVYKKGFTECLQLILSAAGIQLSDNKGGEH